VGLEQHAHALAMTGVNNKTTIAITRVELFCKRILSCFCCLI
jgi:hypothetical protein